MKESSIEDMIYNETEKRLTIMESPSYEFPEKADKKDATTIIAMIAVCLTLIILCMVGVIV